MDVKQMLPLLLKSRLGEKDQMLIKATGTRDPAALTALITKMRAERERVDTGIIVKRLLPDATLGKLIKYFDATKKRN